MTLSQKIQLITQAHADTDGVSFGQRNLILSNLSKNLGLKLWIGKNCWEISHSRRKSPLVILP